LHVTTSLKILVKSTSFTAQLGVAGRDSELSYTRIPLIHPT
jgi:hypothetical protein